MVRARSLAVLLVLGILAGCEKSEPADTAATEKPKQQQPAESPVAVQSVKGRDVIVVVIDGLRGDLLGKSNDQAPYINELAGQGLNFRNAMSNSSHVMQSLSSFFTGRLPTRGGAIGIYEAEPQDQSTTIAQAFQGAGYYTGMLANHPAIQGQGYTKGFQEVQVAQAGQVLDDQALVKRAAEFFEDAGDDHVFLYVHFAGPLASKLVHPDPAADAATAPFNLRDFGKGYNYRSKDLEESPRAKATRDEYYASIKASDAAVKGLVDALKAAGRFDKSVLLLTSLHGFELFEHGYLGAGWTLYEESVRVPLVLVAPNAVPATVTRAPVSLVDVAPSLLTLAGVTFDEASLDGYNLFEADGDKFRYAVVERPRIAELVIPERCIMRSVTTRDWKYVAALDWIGPSERYAVAESHRDTANAIAEGKKEAPPLWSNEREMIFQMPGEVTLTVKNNPEAHAELMAVLTAYQKQCETAGIAPRGPTVTASAVDADQVENLESLGYL